MNDQQKDILFHGLLTPGPSAELRAMVPKDLVSPMMLQQDVYMNDVQSAAVRDFLHGPMLRLLDSSSQSQINCPLITTISQCQHLRR